MLNETPTPKEVRTDWVTCNFVSAGYKVVCVKVTYSSYEVVVVENGVWDYSNTSKVKHERLLQLSLLQDISEAIE